MEEKTCVPVCKRSYKKGDADSLKKLEFLKKGISENYQHHWYVNVLVHLITIFNDI